MINPDEIAKQYGYDHVSESPFVGDDVEIYFLYPFPKNHKSKNVPKIGIPMLLVTGESGHDIVLLTTISRCGIKNLRVIDE